VSTPPRVLLVSTGSELVPAPAPLRHGQIYDANCLITLPEQFTDAGRGDEVDILLLHREE